MWLHVPSTSCPSAPESECSTSDFDSLSRELERSATWRGKPRRAKSWLRDLQTGRFTRLRFGLTSPPSTPERGVAEWIASLEASRVSRGAQPESGAASTMSGGSGTTSGESSPSVDPASFCLRMSLGLYEVEVSDTSFGDLPRSGSMLRGICFERPTSEHRTSESGFSSSEYPTPAANSYGSNQGGAAGRVGPVRPSLETWAKQWPTPNAHDGRRPGSDATSTQGRNLKREAEEDWATPLAGDERASATQNTRSLGRQVRTATGPKSPNTSGRRLNPAFVEWLMGLPPGWTSSAALTGFERWETAWSRRMSRLRSGASVVD